MAWPILAVRGGGPDLPAGASAHIADRTQRR